MRSVKFAVFGMRVRSGASPERFYSVVIGSSYSDASKKAAEIHRKDGYRTYDVEVKTLDT